MNRRNFIAILTASLIAPPSISFGAKPHAKLIQAIIHVESGGNANAVGDGGHAIGILQIHPIMVTDCNRNLGREAFDLSDRLSRSKSVQMFNVYTDHYSKGATDEVIARNWNGGPSGHRKSATLSYWKKVNHQLKEQGS